MRNLCSSARQAGIWTNKIQKILPSGASKNKRAVNSAVAPPPLKVLQQLSSRHHCTKSSTTSRSFSTKATPHTNKFLLGTLLVLAHDLGCDNISMLLSRPLLAITDCFVEYFCYIMNHSKQYHRFCRLYDHCPLRLHSLCLNFEHGVRRNRGEANIRSFDAISFAPISLPVFELACLDLFSSPVGRT